MARLQTMARERHASAGSDVINQIVGTTKNGKSIKVGQDANGYFFVKYVGGGQLPRALVGRFTRYEEAANKILLYLGR